MSTIQGVIHGRSIELLEEPGIPDGRVVAVTIQEIEPSITARPEDIPRVELWMDRLVYDSKVFPGERIVKGTRLAVEMLVAELDHGCSDQDMLQAHPESSKEDLEALRHYARLPVGLRRSFGAWAEDAEELDQFLKELRGLRKLSRREVDG